MAKENAKNENCLVEDEMLTTELVNKPGTFFWIRLAPEGILINDTIVVSFNYEIEKYVYWGSTRWQYDRFFGDITKLPTVIYEFTEDGRCCVYQWDNGAQNDDRGADQS